jgi:hypothetical protein
MPRGPLRWHGLHEHAAEACRPFRMQQDACDKGWAAGPGSEARGASKTEAKQVPAARCQPRLHTSGPISLCCAAGPIPCRPAAQGPAQPRAQLARACCRSSPTRAQSPAAPTPAASTSPALAQSGRPSVASAMATSSRGESAIARRPRRRGCSRSGQSSTSCPPHLRALGLGFTLARLVRPTQAAGPAVPGLHLLDG